MDFTTRRAFLLVLVAMWHTVVSFQFKILATGSQRSLLNSYLDDLSAESHDEGTEQRKTWGPSQKNGPQKWAATSGGVPTGRGPEASYLQGMGSGGASQNEPVVDQDEETEEESDSFFRLNKNQEKPASWSAEYLKDLDSSAHDDPRTDIRNLLTQRSIQSFMRLLEECRDPHSAKWIQEDFLQTGNLLDYHGTGAAFIENFGGTWDAALLAMLQQPEDRIVISAKRRGRGHGGWSKNNPFLQERWVEMNVDIHPTSLCDRILAVREQLAREWRDDLDVVVTANSQLLEAYLNQVRVARDSDRGGQGEAIEQEGKLERISMNLLNNNARSTASSPFRRANFDLVYTLCTQAAIHRLLRQASEKQNGSFLKEFYIDTAVEFFDGELPFGRADAFMEELLQLSPSYSGDGHLVDPLGTAEEIIRMRTTVATEWKDLMDIVPNEHVYIKQAMFSERARQGADVSTSGADGSDASAFQ